MLQASKGKQAYFEVLRTMATFAVVFLHIVMTLVANYSVDDIGVLNYAIFNGCYMLVKWAVPCFIMITGALLLNPNKKVDIVKIKAYIWRMVLVLCSFGVIYSLMELVFSTHSFRIGFLLKAVLYTAEGKTWSHMWYIYLLIGLYLVTIPLRYVVEKCSEKELMYILLILVGGNFIIPTINSIFQIKLENYMLVGEYFTYYIMGYYLSSMKKKVKYSVLISLLGASALIMICTEVFSIIVYKQSYSINHEAGNILTFLMSTTIFLLVKELCIDKDVRISKFVEISGKYSFAVYLVHPFFINLIYKVLGFTPLSMNIWVGIILLDIIVAALSLAAAVVIKRIPLLKKIV